MKITKWIVPAVVLSGTIGLGCSSNRGGDSGQGASSGSRGSSMYSGSQQQQSRSSQLSTSDMRKVEQALKGTRLRVKS